MKPLLTLFLLCLLTGLGAQSRCDSTFKLGDTTVCIDRNSINKRIVTWKYYLAGKPVLIQGRRYYKDGRLEVRTRRDDYEFTGWHGPAWAYYPSGKLMKSWTYVEGKIEGPWLSFYENGKPQCQCYFKNNKREGSQQVYHENGQLRVRWHAERSRILDVSEYYDETGRPLEIGTLKNGTGVLYDYDVKGRRTKETTFRDGKKKRVKKLKF